MSARVVGGEVSKARRSGKQPEIRDKRNVEGQLATGDLDRILTQLGKYVQG